MIPQLSNTCLVPLYVLRVGFLLLHASAAAGAGTESSSADSLHGKLPFSPKAVQVVVGPSQHMKALGAVSQTTDNVLRGFGSRKNAENLVPSEGSASRLLLSLGARQQVGRRIPPQGRDVKRAKDHVRKRDIPDVTLSAVHDLWEAKDRRSLKDFQVAETSKAEIDRWDASDLSNSNADYRNPATQGTAAEAGLSRQQSNAQDVERTRSSARRMLRSMGLQHNMRDLAAERPNGVSEMPDPEAAEYLSHHQSKDLGADVMNAAKLHYNGTREGSVHPLNTDKHATTEEHVTQGLNEASLRAQMQESKAVVERYATIHLTNKVSKSDQRSHITSSVGPARSAESPPKQEGYPWYAEFPDPSFPQPHLKKTNRTIYNQLMENNKKQSLLDRTVGQSPPNSVADMTRDSRKAAEKRSQASIWSRSSLKGPGDGGELPPGSYIFTTSGAAADTPAREARDSLSRMRAQARVWMSSQEVSLIESYLRPGDIMLEFGAGYSTMWFSQFVKEYYSIEHNATWFDEIKTQINSTRENVRLQVAPVERGFKGWGGGFEEGTFAQFERYILAVDNFKVTRFDRVLIDGRARAACAEYVLKFLHSDSLVFIHDYSDRYVYHDTAEKYYVKVADILEGQSLVVLRPKPEALKQAAREAVASLATT